MLLFHRCVLYCIGVFADTTIPPTSHALFLSSIREYSRVFVKHIVTIVKSRKIFRRKTFKLLIVSTWPLGLEKAQFPSQYVQNCYKNPMKALSSASVVGRIGNDKVSDICGHWPTSSYISSFLSCGWAKFSLTAAAIWKVSKKK